MNFMQIYLQALIIILALMTLLWIVSIFIKNVSIVDLFWGFGFVVAGSFYFMQGEGELARKVVVLCMVAIWGIRLSVYLAWRNIGKGEDFRYQQFRKNYGKGYWWISYFQTFLLQGLLMWMISAPLLGAQLRGGGAAIGWLDWIGMLVWIIGITFEAGGDYQLSRFKANPENRGKVLDTGFWRLTRHPNYFGDTAVWWGFACMSLAAGSYWPVLGSLVMTLLIIKVSGVALLEKSLNDTKPQYKAYIERTSAFFPWFPKKKQPHDS